MALFLLTAALVATVLGAVAAILGNKWWFVERAVGLLMSALVLFGLVGP
jgi:hypothetical protein